VPLVPAIEDVGEVEGVWVVEAVCGSERKRVLRRAWIGDGVVFDTLGISRRRAR
jgi:hypothetical protein